MPRVQALTGFLVLFPVWASLRGSQRGNVSNETERSVTGPVPSRITGCPSGYMDCGSCLCVPATTCDSCLAAVPNLPNPAPAPATPPSNGEPVPSTIPGCPAGYVDCGGCFCTPRSTCDACNVTRPPTLWPGLPNGSNGTNETNATVPHLNFTPSRVPQCPRGGVDCGTCLCVSVATCAYCPGAWTPSPPVSSPGGVVPVHSRVPGCPANYYDCGTCQCVPHSTCQWCPAGAGGSVPVPGRPLPGPAPAPPATPVHSRVPGCPANYYDCGTCQCVPHSTCQWCPAGAGGSVPVPAPGNPANPTPPRGAVPSTIVGCPANYYDCGSCRCVPRGTCQWCGGVSFVAGTNSSDDDHPLRI